MKANSDTAAGRLRIGELAEITGSTTRAIRHYHAIGLLPEPRRDGSGYRRYGAQHLVLLVRIRRLRSLGMPLDQIAANLVSEPGGRGGLPGALQSLAEDLSRQIDTLRTVRARILEIAASNALAAPAEIWAPALRSHGLLDEATALPAGEREAAELLDALHPEGIEGVFAQASELISDPSRIETLGPLLQRFQSLPDDAGDDAVERLASELAGVIPRPREALPAIDLATMDKLLGDRLSPAKRRCLQRVRELLEARDR